VETVLLNQQLQITMKQYKCQVHQENIQLHLIQMEEQHLIVKHQHINLQVGIQMQQMDRGQPASDADQKLRVSL
jgi:hypothetical protein